MVTANIIHQDGLLMADESEAVLRFVRCGICLGIVESSRCKRAPYVVKVLGLDDRMPAPTEGVSLHRTLHSSRALRVQECQRLPVQRVAARLKHLMETAQNPQSIPSEQVVYTDSPLMIEFDRPLRVPKAIIVDVNWLPKEIAGARSDRVLSSSRVRAAKYDAGAITRVREQT